MAKTGRIELGAGNEAANAATILTRRRFVGIDLEVEGICKCVHTLFVRLQTALDQFVTLIAILKTKCNIQVAGKADIDRHHEVRTERRLVRNQIARAKRRRCFRTERGVHR
ncbi:MAG: hypothetical protein IIB68_12825, partial [Proteobacteria bacterium]|nr:hypothetical protein [Pseudomonadota bacterium]